MIELKNTTNLSSPPPIGNTTPNSGAFNSVTVTATSSASPALTLTPVFASPQIGLSVSQDGPRSGSFTGNLNLNQIIVNSDNANGSTITDYTNGLYIEMTTGGGATHGSKSALNALVNFGSTSVTAGDTIAGTFTAQASAINGGTDTSSGAAGTLFGGSFISNLKSGATNYFSVSGAEVDVGINTGGSAKHRLGWSIIGTGSVAAASLDCALEISATGQPFKTGILVSSLHGAAGISTGGTILGTDGTTGVTVTDFANFSNYSFAGNIFNFGSSYSVSGAGAISAKSVQLSSIASIGSTAAPDAPLTVNSNTAATVSAGTPHIHVIGADSSIANITMDAFAQPNTIIGRRADGTLASKSAVGANTELAAFLGYSWDGSVYQNNSAVAMFTSNAQSTSDHSSHIGVYTTPVSSTTLTEVARFNEGGDVNIAKATGTAAGGAKALTMGSAGPSMYWGSGVPSLTGQVQGSIYLRTDGSSTTNRMYVATSTASSSAAWASLTASS